MGVETTYKCDRKGCSSKLVTNEEQWPRDEAIKEGWIMLQGCLLFSETFLCPHCVSELNKFMRGEPTDGVITMHEDSVSLGTDRYEEEL